MARGMPACTFKFYHEVLYELPNNEPLRFAMATFFDAIAAQSPSIASNCRNWIPDNRPVKTLPCFAMPLEATGLAKLPDSREQLRFCYFGRLASNKGLDRLLNAFARVADTLNARLDIHGDGPESKRLKDAIAVLGLQERVKLHGRYPEGSAYAAVLATYHGLILPSIGYEGLPLVLIEAMSCGLPFLATTIGAIPDAAVDNEDVMLMNPEEDGMAEGIVDFAAKLRLGAMANTRLKAFYDRHYSPAVHEDCWRRMLCDPKAYFS